MKTQLSGDESGQDWDDFFYNSGSEGRSRAVRGGWPTMMVWIQCFGFSSRGE
jgi:hypothetical protein